MNPDPQAIQAIQDLITKEQGFKDGHAANIVAAQSVIQQAQDAVTTAQQQANDAVATAQKALDDATTAGQQAVSAAQTNAAAVATAQQALIVSEQNGEGEDQQIIDGLNALVAQLQGVPAQ